MYGPTWPLLLTYGSHDKRHTGFRRLTMVNGPEDMLSSPLGQHILSYEPPCGFVIPSFSMYDGSFDLYDHMLHFNQAMILNAGDDRLLCKVF